MSKPFDATAKALVEAGPADWLRLAGRADPPPVTLIDADLSTVTAAADRVLRVEEPRGGADFWLAHFEFMVTNDPELVDRLRKYYGLLRDRHHCPVSTVIVLLRREAESPRLTGTARDADPLTGREQVFEYLPVVARRLSTETLLAGGLGTVPLAVLGDAADDDMPTVLTRVSGRLRAELPAAEADERMQAAFNLLGLRFDREIWRRLMSEFLTIEQVSTTPAVMMELGRLFKARANVLALGRQRFGEPDEATQGAIQATDDEERLDRLLLRVYQVGSWAELLAEPGEGTP